MGGAAGAGAAGAALGAAFGAALAFGGAAGAGAGVCAHRSGASKVTPRVVAVIKAKTRPRGHIGAANLRKFIAENPF